MDQNSTDTTVHTPVHREFPTARPTFLRSQCRRVRKYGAIGLLGTCLWVNSASAQVLIPYGDFDNDIEKYLVAAISLILLIFAMWRYFRNRR